jgi:hypothetical protein
MVAFLRDRAVNRLAATVSITRRSEDGACPADAVETQTNRFFVYNIWTCDGESIVNFNIYLDDETGQRLTAAASQRGETRNAVIRQAVQDWLRRDGKTEWPALVLSHTGMPDMPPFEAGREELVPPPGDPLA